jgi:WD40 repeat protein
VASQDLVSAPQEQGAAVAALAFSPDGTLLAAAGGDDVSQDYIINIWDVAAGESLVQLAGHTNVVGGVAFNSSGNTLISASEDKTVRFWGVAG